MDESGGYWKEGRGEDINRREKEYPGRGAFMDESGGDWSVGREVDTGRREEWPIPTITESGKEWLQGKTEIKPKEINNKGEENRHGWKWKKIIKVERRHKEKWTRWLQQEYEYTVHSIMWEFRLNCRASRTQLAIFAPKGWLRCVRLLIQKKKLLVDRCSLPVLL